MLKVGLEATEYSDATMNKKNWPQLSASRAAEIFKEMISLRQIYCEDTHFFKMNDFWQWLSEGDENINIREVKKSAKYESKYKAGVVALGDHATLVVPESMMVAASQGRKLENFTLAHEFAHLALGHHERNAVIKNFQLFSPDGVNANIPPNEEELEANYAAVFFQCGGALLSNNDDAVSIANRAFTDVYYTRKALGVCKLEAFRKELQLITSRYPRVTL